MVIKLQKTPRDSAEHREGETESQWTGVQRTRRHHLGPAGDWADGQGGKGVGEGVRMVEGGRWRKGPLDRRNPGAYRYLFDN